MSVTASSSTGGAGPPRHSEYALRAQTAHLEPIARRQGYTEPYLSLQQHAALVGTASIACAVVSRPVAKLEYFYFLSDVPGESNRIFLSDKRAQFFRVLFNTSWWSGRVSLVFLTIDYAASLGFFLGFRALYTAAFLSRRSGGAAAHKSQQRMAPPYADSDSHPTREWSFLEPTEPLAIALGEPRRVLCGFLAGASAGVASCAIRHPYDVLHATADMQSGPRRFKGPWDVLWTALREKPAVLRGIYSGFGMAATGRALRFGAQFGVYDWLRYDGTYRGTVFLFLYCHAASVLGMALEYPLLSMKQQLKHVNAMTQGTRPMTYRALFYELRRRHGLSKMWEGFFTTRPFLNAMTPALLMTLYDVGSRRWTESLYPYRRRAQGESAQSLTSIALPEYAKTPADAQKNYEFEHRTQRTERERRERS